MTKKEKVREVREEFFCLCPMYPLYLLFKSFSKKREKHPDFFEHLDNARKELLLGIKSLLEDRIAEIEERKKKVTKIEVEG
ncbi:MAG: hypothetical protein LWW78_07200 [Deltaproteobacteria bacterium]|nr:hypothetical protein [Deltaproteobacteria bacterium]